ncbi:amidohydrolase family protein [candidate division KSB1 bacterium]|nr:amidohydrolase family protein [candidate division KSB1 bacterium]NIR69690.1 amidohydrolase family protein [candidate division KSB1 bacterium]NIS24340.1 amidohydrolase family protein [candidate division KSB1 bacterium]NIT71268.1 amidohydrolase family protein [candidate division KSB1 bacterium]NIU24974.1 amidohydrolase family protein [candidate division KSB1 bacterium]
MKPRRPAQSLSVLFSCCILSFALIALQDAFGFQSITKHEFDILIINGRILDGTGNPWFEGDVGIRDGRIVAVGELQVKSAVRTIDVQGKYVTPGFIDLHSHADDTQEIGSTKGLRSRDPKRRAAPNLVSQGITTVVVNQDGRSPTSIAQQRGQLEQSRFGPNAVLLVGHNTIRALAMAQNAEQEFSSDEIKKMQRHATDEEIATMRQLLKQGMEAGAYGLSAGLEYIPGRWSSTEEIVALVEEIVPFGGVYICHERSSGAEPMWYLPSYGNDQQPTFLDNIVELIEVGERTGATVVATHIKARGANFWGSSHAAIQLINRARKRGVQIWADQYPYNTSGSDGNTRLIPGWIRGDEIIRFSANPNDKKNYAEAVRTVLNQPGRAEKLRADILHEVTRRGGAENIIVMDYPDSSFIGKSLRELANDLNLSLVDLAIKLQLEGFPDRRGGAQLRGFSMSEMDVEAYGAQPWTATASDAGVALPGDDPVHARFYGTFPRKIREYAVERGILSVADAVRSATSLPAQILGFRNRGLIREGFHADLVIFDLDRLRDTATFFEPHQYAEGIEYVAINGEFVVEDGEFTYTLPGVVITPKAARHPPKISNRNQKLY